MHRIIIKISLGCIIGLMLFFSMELVHRNLIDFVLCFVWSTGIVFGLKKGLQVLHTIIDSSFKLSIISWVSIGTGIVGLLLLLATVILMLGLGWIYGYYVLYTELKGI